MIIFFAVGAISTLYFSYRNFFLFVVERIHRFVGDLIKMQQFYPCPAFWVIPPIKQLAIDPDPKFMYTFADPCCIRVHFLGLLKHNKESQFYYTAKCYASAFHHR